MPTVGAAGELAVLRAELLASLRASFGVLQPSIIEILRQNAETVPNQAAILEPGRPSLSYVDLLHLATHTAGALRGRGLGRGSRLVVALPTSSESAAAYIALMAAATVLPTSAGAPADEYERSLRHTRADAVYVQQHRAPPACEAAARLGIPVLELAYEAQGPVGLFSLAGAGVSAAPDFARPADTALVLPTSGTTSLPKLAPWSQQALLTVGYLGRDIFQVPDAAPYPVVGLLPLYHTGGCLPIIRSLCWRTGYSSVPGFDGAAIYRYLALFSPASILVTPALLQLMVDEAASHAAELKRLELRKITSVAASMPPQLLQQAQRIFGAAVQILYGMTEVPAIAHTVLAPGSANYSAGFVGQPTAFCRVKIAHDDGQALPPMEAGEIVVLTPRAFAGYENDAPANGAAFRDGWFCTGDTGYLGESGALFLTGRVKELINRGGSKVAPLDVDVVLLEHPAVAEAATFGFPHATLGEDIAVAIVLKEAGVTERELRLFAARRLASYKVPSRIVFVTEIPKTALGKVRRLALAERFRAELQR